MSQSLSAVHVHIVFSTQGRIPFLIDPNLRPRLYAGLANMSNRLECKVVLIGGVADHVHILARQSPKVCLSDWVRELKSKSTPFLKRQDPALSKFAWQAGYGAFSVGAGDLNAVRRYIERQEEHHRSESFQDELRRILRENEMEWDEKYIWS